MLQDCLREALAMWLRGVNQDSKPTWKGLVDALRSQSVSENQLAKLVEEKYCNVGEYQVARVNYSDYLRHLYQDIAPVQMLKCPIWHIHVCILHAVMSSVLPRHASVNAMHLHSTYLPLIS